TGGIFGIGYFKTAPRSDRTAQRACLVGVHEIVIRSPRRTPYDANLVKPTLPLPLVSSILRASSGLALGKESSPRMRRILATGSALDGASSPRPRYKLSSRPTRTLPPIMAPNVTNGIW